MERVVLTGKRYEKTHRLYVSLMKRCEEQRGGKAAIGGEFFYLKTNECTYGRDVFSARTGMKQGAVARCMDILKRFGIIQVRIDTGIKSVVTIVKELVWISDQLDTAVAPSAQQMASIDIEASTPMVTSRACNSLASRVVAEDSDLSASRVVAEVHTVFVPQVVAEESSFSAPVVENILDERYLSDRHNYFFSYSPSSTGVASATHDDIYITRVAEGIIHVAERSTVGDAVAEQNTDRDAVTERSTARDAVADRNTVRDAVAEVDADGDPICFNEDEVVSDLEPDTDDALNYDTVLCTGLHGEMDSKAEFEFIRTGKGSDLLVRHFHRTMTTSFVVPTDLVAKPMAIDQKGLVARENSTDLIGERIHASNVAHLTDPLHGWTMEEWIEWFTIPDGLKGKEREKWYEGRVSVLEKFVPDGLGLQHDCLNIVGKMSFHGEEFIRKMIRKWILKDDHVAQNNPENDALPEESPDTASEERLARLHEILKKFKSK